MKTTQWTWIIVLITLLTAIPAGAQTQTLTEDERWVGISFAEDGSSITYLDRTSFRTTSQGAEAWLRKSHESGSYELFLMETNCQDDMLRVAQYARFNEDGRPLGSDNVGLNWQRPVPNTLGEGALMILCEARQLRLESQGELTSKGRE